MPNAARSQFNEVDRSYFVDSANQGLVGVSLVTKRGKFGIGDEVITTYSQFKRIYGGEGVGFEGVTLAKRALEGGASLRVNKQGHFTTIGNPATLDAVKATYVDTTFAKDGADEVFDLTI